MVRIAFCRTDAEFNAGDEWEVFGVIRGFLIIIAVGDCIVSSALGENVVYLIKGLSTPR